MTHPRLRGIAALALSLVLVGCSSSGAAPDGPGPAAGPIPDPCALLDSTQIETITGVSFQEGVFNTDLSTDFQSICDWHPMDGAFPLVQVLVSPGASTVAAQRESAESIMGATVDVSVTGGDNAYTVAGGSILGMTVDDYFVQVAFMTSDLYDVSTMTGNLAEVVAATL
ncbi:MAG: hypothetical protein JW722_06370 [Demequinaceae bacterium]|nr:hypothetical protein [Demequinaceae bacterium]